MNIKNKFTFVFLFFIACMLSLTAFTYNLFIKNEVSNLEKTYIKENLTQLNTYLDTEKDSLLSLTKDWAAWTDAWLFMKGKNPNFPENNITIESFINNNLYLIAYFDLSGNLKAGFTYDAANNNLIIARESFWKKFTNFKSEKSLTLKDIKSVGFSFINKKIGIVAVHPVLKSDSSGNISGYLVMARLLTQEKLDFIKKFLDFTQLNIREKDDESNTSKIDMEIKEDEISFKAILIKEDFFGDKNIILEITKKKKIWHLVENNVKRLILIYLLAFLTIGLIFYEWISRNIVFRIKDLVDKIGKLKNGSINKIETKENDEIGYLSKEINSYIDKINKQILEIEENKKIYEIVAEKSESIILIFNKNEEILFANNKAYEILANENISKNLLTLLKEVLTINNNERTFLSDFRLFDDLYISGWIVPVGDNEKILFMAHDISYIKREKDKLFELASKDSLTSLYNRAYFESILKKILNSFERDSTYYLIFIDLDNLKLVNDKYGHIVGDEIIRLTAECVLKSIREDDLAARWGGDEFVVIIKGNEDVVKSVAERIQNRLRNIESNIIPNDFIPTVSIGIAKIEHDKDLETIIREADKSAYDAKREGKNKIKIFNPAE